MKIWELNLNSWIESLHKYVIPTSRQNTCESIFLDLLVSCKDKDIWIISNLSSVFTEYCHTLTCLWWNLKSRFLCEAGGCTAVWWDSIICYVKYIFTALVKFGIKIHGFRNIFVTFCNATFFSVNQICKKRSSKISSSCSDMLFFEFSHACIQFAK